MKNLIEFNGVYFSEGTPEKVMQICSSANRKNRFRFWYGDNKTGKSWNEENDICGYIGRSTGEKKIPLLISKINSFGGGGLLTDCIIKIVDIQTKKVLYQHENFNQSVFVAENGSDIVGYNAKVRANNMVYSNHETLSQAQRFADFMNGKRHNK